MLDTFVTVEGKLIKFIVCLLGLMSLVAWDASEAWTHESEDHDKPRKFTKVEEHKPTPLPDRVVLTWSADPATTMDVTWRTDTTVDQPLIQYNLAAKMVGNMKEGAREFTQLQGKTNGFESDLGKCLIHSARLTELKPDTMYAYRVGDGKHFSEWFQFRTASGNDKPFTFVYFGDAQNSILSLWSRVIREANQHAPRASFMLHAGDLVGDMQYDAEWGEWFQAGGWLNGMIPVVASPGNHEYGDEIGLSPHWRPQFSFPLNGPPGLEETAYWFDYNNARIVSLNSNEKIEEQREWLQKVLKDASRPTWTFVTFHHPIFSAAKDRDNPEIRKAWQAILEDNGVDLVLQGHDHTYARSGLGGPRNIPEGVRNKSSNTVYVVSVSGPKMYEIQESWEVSRIAYGRQLFQVVKVDGDKLRYEARLASGEIYDAFTIEKDANGKNTLIEQIPDDVPEVRSE